MRRLAAVVAGLGLALGLTGASASGPTLDQRAAHACSDPAVVAEFAQGVQALCIPVMVNELYYADR